MGFDQYHEPPEELSAETRTFARPLRLAGRGVAGDRLVPAADLGRARPRRAGDHGRRPGRGVQALRDGPRVPPAAHAALARRSPQGVLFKEGDIVEHGEAAEAASEDDGDAAADATRAARRLARDRQPEGSGAMNHLLRGLAPRLRVRLASCSTTRRASACRDRSRRAAWSTSPARTAGSTRRPTSAGPRSCRRPTVRGHRPAAAGPAAGRAAGRVRGLAGRAARQRSRRRRRRPRGARRGGAADRRRRERRRLPRLAESGDRRDRRGLAVRARAARRGRRGLPALRRPRGRGDAPAPASRARTASRSAPTSTRA